MSDKEIKYVYLNGKLVPKSEAKVSCFDSGVTHGWAVYEGIRVYNGKVLNLDAHINRLFDSAKGALIKIPLNHDEFRKAVIETVKANGFREAHVRPWVSHGERGGVPNIFIIAGYAKSEMGKEVKAIVSALRRTACDSIDAKIKTNSRLDLMLANEEAKRAGAEYAIMLDKEGFVAEVSMANIFVIKNGGVFTPFTTNALGGITRDLLMDLIRSAGYVVGEKNMTFQDLYSADEVFLCGTGAEIKAIINVDGRMIGEGKIGQITKKAIELYLKFVRENGEDIY
jgi:branched-chain amino acid aminotransferase